MPENIKESIGNLIVWISIVTLMSGAILHLRSNLLEVTKEQHKDRIRIAILEEKVKELRGLCCGELSDKWQKNVVEEDH